MFAKAQALEPPRRTYTSDFCHAPIALNKKVGQGLEQSELGKQTRQISWIIGGPRTASGTGLSAKTHPSNSGRGFSPCVTHKATGALRLCQKHKARPSQARKVEFPVFPRDLTQHISIVICKAAKNGEDYHWKKPKKSRLLSPWWR